MTVMNTKFYIININLQSNPNYKIGKDLSKIEDMVKAIKSRVGIVLKEAFAKAHIHRPVDSKIFLARYLMNLEHNEKLITQKLQLYELCKDFPRQPNQQQQPNQQEQPQQLP